MKRFFFLPITLVATSISMIITSCGDSPEKNYEKAQEYLFVKEDLEMGKKYLEKAAKGGHKKAQKQLDFLNLSNDDNKSKEEDNQSQNIKKEEKTNANNSISKEQSIVSADEQLKDLRRKEVTLKNRVDNILAAKYNQKHTFGEHTMAMRRAMSSISSLFQQSLSSTDEKTKARIVAQIQQQCTIAEQNAEWIETNAPLRQAVVEFETNALKEPLSIFSFAELKIKRGSISKELNDLKEFENQIDSLLEATDFKEAQLICQKITSNITKTYVAIGEAAIEQSDNYTHKICVSVLSKIAPEQSVILEKKSSDQISKIKQQIEKLISEKDWANAEKALTELRKFKAETEEYQQKIFYGSLLSSIAFNEKNLLAFSLGNETIYMVPVQAGSFTMIDSLDTNDINRTHDVSIKQNYYIGITEITQKQWETVMGQKGNGGNRPKTNVSWNDTQEFCKVLNKLTEGKRPDGYVFSLPTDAQWEYAARGGTMSKGYKYTGSDNLTDVAWFSDNSNLEIHTVGTKKPNELGLFDILGNVGEWCLDGYRENYRYPSNGDKAVLLENFEKVIRGGKYNTNGGRCNLSCRDSGPNYVRDSDNGFRLALVREQE